MAVQNSPSGSPTGTVNASGAGTQAPTEAQRDALAYLRNVLSQYGLDSLAGWAWDQILQARSADEILIDLRETTEYKTRFAGLAALAAKGRAISETQYISLEQTYTQIMRTAGFPQGFYDDPSDFSRFIANEVSPAELQERVDMAVRAGASVMEAADPMIVNQLRNLYGIGPADVGAFFLDEQRALPVLQQKFRASAIAAEAARTSFGNLEVTDAERLAQIGVQQDEARQGFGALAAQRELFEALPGQGEEQINTRTRLAALFEGNAAASELIERRRAQREAQFRKGGTFAASREGFGGLGSARS